MCKVHLVHIDTEGKFNDESTCHLMRLTDPPSTRALICINNAQPGKRRKMTVKTIVDSNGVKYGSVAKMLKEMKIGDYCRVNIEIEHAVFHNDEERSLVEDIDDPLPCDR